MILTGLRFKELSLGVVLGKGNMPKIGYILGLASWLLQEITRGLDRETKAELLSY